MLGRLANLFGALATLLLGASTAMACPFCSAVSQTFSQQIEAMDTAVIATLVEVPEGASETAGAEATFKIDVILKGQEHLKGVETIQSLYYGEGRQGRQFLILGTEPENLMWSTPTLLTDRGVKYVQQVIKLPETGNERYSFFQDHLEDEDEMLTQDAYDEFANAPYEALFELEPLMKHDQLVEWLHNYDLPANRRRLYFTMLGVCGSKDDLPMLEKMLQSDDRRAKAGLDAMIGCYLTLAGAEGLPLIEKLYLEDKDAEYADTYAAIMAIRFHGTETDVIPQERLLKSLHKMLDRPALADLVIADFARWEDWSVADRLVQMFKEADDETSWVRVPVIRYLMACPKPEAKQYLIELEKIDPDSMKRAQTFFPFQSSAVPTRADGEKLAAARKARKAEQEAAEAQTVASIQDEAPAETPERQVKEETQRPGSQTAQARAAVTRDAQTSHGDRALAAAITANGSPSVEMPRIGLLSRLISVAIPLTLTFGLMLGISAILWNPGNRVSS